MALRPLLIALTLLAAVLAGCTSEPASVDLAAEPAAEDHGDEGAETTDDSADDADDTDGADDADDTDDADAGADSGDEEAGNTAPTATLDAPESAEAGAVNITIEAQDADGDALTWSLDIGNDAETDAEGTGADLPYTHAAVLEAGDHEVVLTVSDGTDEVVASLMITVTEAVEAEPEPLVFAGSVLVPTGTSAVGTQIIGYSCTGAFTASGLDGNTYDLEQDVEGWSYEVTSGYWVYFYDDALNLLEDGASGTAPGGATILDVCVDLDTTTTNAYEAVITPP